MNKAKSVFSNGRIVVHLGNIVGVERYTPNGVPSGANIIHAFARWNDETNHFEPNTYIYESEYEEFVKEYTAWCDWAQRMATLTRLYGQERLADVSFYIESRGSSSIPPLETLQRVDKMLDEFDAHKESKELTEGESK